MQIKQTGCDMRAKEIAGWIGLLLLQSVNIPPTIATLQGVADVPLSMPVMTFCGLCCYMVRAIADNDKLYMTGNGIGMISSLALFVSILYQ